MNPQTYQNLYNTYSAQANGKDRIKSGMAGNTNLKRTKSVEYKSISGIEEMGETEQVDIYRENGVTMTHTKAVRYVPKCDFCGNGAQKKDMRSCYYPNCTNKNLCGKCQKVHDRGFWYKQKKTKSPIFCPDHLKIVKKQKSIVWLLKQICGFFIILGTVLYYLGVLLIKLVELIISSMSDDEELPGSLQKEI